MQNPKAYNGSEPYIFISYAHKDDELVYPIITKMQNDGYRVWYDEGITPATVWAKNIAKRITDCSFFIAFVSTNYLNSDNCLNELDYGYKKCNHRLLIHLENINLPEDIDMNWGRIQALLKHKYIEDVDFYKDLYSSKCISNTKSSAGSFAISLDNGDVYTGDVNNDGKFHGNGTMKYADGSLYTGEWRDNKRNGKGCIKYANGNSYDGEWRDDKRNGHGVFHYESGEFYDGEWRDDLMNGHGIFNFANGTIYEGEFRDDLMNGHGTITFTDGNMYDGEWRDNNRNGHGVCWYDDGTMFEGEFRDNKRNGYGVVSDSDGHVLYSGYWIDGELEE